MIESRSPRSSNALKWAFFALMALSALLAVCADEGFLLHPADSHWQHIQPYRWLLMFHGLFGATALLMGPAQFSSRLSQARPQLHRWSGRIYIVAVAGRGAARRIYRHGLSAPRNDDLKICPAPTPENIAGRSRRSLAYQSQITGLPEGFDVELNSVRFDGCDEVTRRMIEAKGLGMEWMLNWPYNKLIQSKFYRNMMRQAERQNNASEGRGNDYYFADTRMEKFFGAEFEHAGYSNIRVHQVDANVKKFIEYMKWLGTRILGRPFIEHRI